MWQVHHAKIMALAANMLMTKNTEMELYIAAPLSDLKAVPSDM